MSAQLGIDGKLDFGKHNGKSVLEVIQNDPTYLLFLRRPSEKAKTGYAMTKELHMTMDALLYANPKLGERGKNEPRHSKQDVDLFMADLEGAASRLERKAAEVQGVRATAYGSEWGAWG